MIELAIVIPTYNERDNIVPLLDRLAQALGPIRYEVIFVDDDSTDGTSALIREIAQRNPQIRGIDRVNRRGLASACIEGMLSTSAPFIAVMDADMQHDERILPDMLHQLRSSDLDIVVGSRNVEGGSMGDFARSRVLLSSLGRRFSQSVCRCPIQDPMSGFFMLRRSFLNEVSHRVSGIGFKILVDLLASSKRPVRLAEVPYRFRNRVYGKSKLDVLVGVEYLKLLLDKRIGEFIPYNFVLFGLVGASGVALHLVVLWFQLFSLQVPFRYAQVTAALVAMTANFLLNNAITYRDRYLHGWQLMQGLVLFYIACSVGLFINSRVADFLAAAGGRWYVAGVIGLVVGSVWNYGVTSVLIWGMLQKKRRERMVSREVVAAVSHGRSSM
jgi:dolichol-phosphate mannosyltransferase